MLVKHPATDSGQASGVLFPVPASGIMVLGHWHQP